MNKASTRNSSFELLRIICIIFIISHHYFVHGGYDIFTYKEGGGVLFIQLISMFGSASCSIFALISGYFLMNKKEDTPPHSTQKIYIKIMPLVMEMFFYSAIIWIVFYLTKVVPISKIDTIKSFLPIFYGNWYVVFYILIYIMFPFINKMLKSLSKKDYLRFLMIIVFIWSIIPTFTHAWEMSSIDFFIVNYLIGAYIKLHVQNIKKYKNKLCVISILSATLMLLSVIVFDFIGKMLKNNSFISHATYFCHYYNIIAVIWAVSLFCLFSCFNFHNKVIDYIAPSVLGIYLIHDNLLMRTFIWQTIYPNKDFIGFPYMHACIKIVSVFLICLLIDIVRRQLNNICTSYIAKFIKPKTYKPYSRIQ